MISRRDFLRISAMASAAALVNWQCPVASARSAKRKDDQYDAVIIGAGLGGLSCAALLAMSGYRPLVLEKNHNPGGYATSFQRGDFTCEASLHGVTGQPLSQQILAQLGVADKLNFVPHEASWSSRYPGLPLDLPQPPRNENGEADVNQALANAYQVLVEMFPDDALGIGGYMNCWGGLLVDIDKFYGPDGGMPAEPTDFDAFKEKYPVWAKLLYKTLDNLFEDYGINTQPLKAILGQSWPYYGLPASQIPAWLYLMYTGMYYGYGNFYIQGTSRSLTDALVETIRDAGGKVLMKTEVQEILIEEEDIDDETIVKAVGVKAKKTVGAKPKERYYYAGAVVSNVAVPVTFNNLLPTEVSDSLGEYMASVKAGRPSTSHVNVWLGLDLSRDYNGTFMESYGNLRSSTLVYGGFDHDVAYDALLRCDPYEAGIAILSYDKVLPNYSPEGHLTLTLSMLSGYEPWQDFAEDYRNGDKTAYYDEKNRIASQMIDYIEQRVLPGLSDLIVMQEASTPLTNIRLTNNTNGAIYGYDVTMDNAGFVRQARFGQRTPIDSLYIAGAWSYPGGGFEPVMLSGVEAVKCMIEDGAIVSS